MRCAVLCPLAARPGGRAGAVAEAQRGNGSRNVSMGEGGRPVISFW